MTAYYSNELAGTLRAFAAAVSDAQRLAARGEFGDPLPALLDYAAVLLDVIDVELLEAGLPPDSRELTAAGRLREKFDRLLVTLRHSAQRSFPAGAR
jgi:hypothetical protein